MVWCAVCAKHGVGGDSEFVVFEPNDAKFAKEIDDREGVAVCVHLYIYTPRNVLGTCVSLIGRG